MKIFQNPIDFYQFMVIIISSDKEHNDGKPTATQHPTAANHTRGTPEG
jgi:hypothetical protein